MKLIVGLGNFGEKYEKTRHNLGFMAVENFLKEFHVGSKTLWEQNKKCKSDIAFLHWQSKKTKEVTKVIFAKPRTYMNLSGVSVALLAQYYQILPENIWILADDIDLHSGFLRIRFGGGTAGHRGVSSVLDALGTDAFWRFRMGVGRPGHLTDGVLYTEQKQDVEAYVLGSFSGAEWGKMKVLLDKTTSAIALALDENLEIAMQTYNIK